MTAVELDLQPSITDLNEKIDSLAQIIQFESCCAICLEQIKLKSVGVILSCEHNFHHICIKNWIVIKGVCPMCRTII